MTKKRNSAWLWGLLTVAPFLLGAKGCDAVVGNEPKSCGGLAGDRCARGEFCDFAAGALCGAADQTGVCRPIPEACTLELDPVCGCDDRTYGNACAAHMAGVSVASEGECDGGGGGEPVVCGGLRGATCDAGEFCNFPRDALCGFADATGTCEPRPDVCADVFSPVCGCDGNTYPNACEANAAGVSVASDGECDGGGGEVCGGITGAQCERGEFCDFPIGQCLEVDDLQGRCAPIPDACDTRLDPVCGCDGQTYGNACTANLAGVSVAHEGECDDGGGEPVVCGGLTGARCGAGQFCHFPPDASCGIADQTGECRDIPEACTTELDPVCGCDGRTYGNGCTAAMAGVSVAHEGECETTDPGFCGGIAGFECPAGRFCNYPESAMCGAGDMPGECTPIPEGCTAEHDPVCGCDDRTYSNACMAHASAVSVARRGACE